MAADPTPNARSLTAGADRRAVALRWGRGGLSIVRGRLRRSLASFGTSLIVHAILLVALALWLLPPPRLGPEAIDVGFVESGGVDMFEPTPATIEAAGATPVDASALANEAVQRIETRQAVSLPSEVFDPAPSSTEHRSPEEPVEARVEPTGGGWEGRRADRREAMLAQGGGNTTSEGAVTAGLEWLVRHQHANGAWTFDLTQEPCAGRCRHSSSLVNATGATGLALLCFFGQDHTHTNESPYRESIHKGVYFLVRSIHPTPHGGDLQQGTMYAHGIATLALCEAYGLTHDPALKDAAQSAVDFICHAQHPRGGWRYSPGQPGDTTVFGWQLMALKSASMAGLRVPSEVRVRARNFLDSVQQNQGAYYGYLHRGKEPTPTSVGLLSRMYMGWPHGTPALHRGVEYLASRGPSKTDMYYNYYATQVMFHYRTAGWTGWNHRLSRYLIRTQARTGHEMGSWYFDDKYAREAGRHYVTCLAIMILEVYYRHMPLYDLKKLNRREF